MTPAVISSLIAVGVALMVAVALTVQSIENARKERHRQVLALRERTRKAQDLLTNIPSTYLPENLHSLLLFYLIGRYKEMLLIEPKNPQAAAQLQQFEQLAQNAYSSTADSTQLIFQDHLTAQAARTRLKELVTFVIEIHNQGLLDRSSAQQHIQSGKFAYALLALDTALLTAREMEHSANPKLALSHYQNCLKNTEKLSEYLPLPNKQSLIESRIASLRETLEQEEAEAQKQAQEAQAIADEWNEYDQEKESWQIKQDYE